MPIETRNPSNCSSAEFDLKRDDLILFISSCAAHPDIQHMSADEFKSNDLPDKSATFSFVGISFDRNCPDDVDRQVGLLGEKCANLCASCPQFSPRFPVGVPRCEPARILYASGS